MFCSTTVSQKSLVKKKHLYNYSKCQLNLNIKTIIQLITNMITNYQITKSIDCHNWYILYLIVIVLIISY